MANPEREPVESKPAVETPREQPDSDDLPRLLTEFLALREFTIHYLMTAADRTGDRVRQIGRWTAAGLLAVLATSVLVILLVIYTVRGVDQALCIAFGREWLGHLVTGLSGLGMLVGGVVLAFRLGDRKREIRRAGKYEQRKAAQRELLGRDVEKVVE